MTKTLHFWLLSIAALLLIGCDTRSSAPTTQSAGGAGTHSIRLAVIPKGTTHVFWKSVEAGARSAAQEFDVEMVWKGPIKENDRAQQIDIVQQFVSEGVSGIVLAPLDDQALVRPVQDAMRRKVPVVLIDSGLKAEPGRDYISFCATNNRQGGMMGAERLAEILGNKGKVVLLRYLEGSASTLEREAGFLEAMKQHPDIQVLVDNRFGGATAGESQDTAMNLLDQLRQANGVFCSNESTTFGMLLALRQANLIGKIKFVGFDASPGLLEGLNKGEIDALVVQNPIKIGYEGVKQMVLHLRGQSVPQLVDTGVALVTPQNVDTPEIKKLLGTE
jgi:ribose transport system substrate-binding protein